MNLLYKCHEIQYNTMQKTSIQEGKKDAKVRQKVKFQDQVEKQSCFRGSFLLVSNDSKIMSLCYGFIHTILEQQENLYWLFVFVLISVYLVLFF